VDLCDLSPFFFFTRSRVHVAVHASWVGTADSTLHQIHDSGRRGWLSFRTGAGPLNLAASGPDDLRTDYLTFSLSIAVGTSVSAERDRSARRHCLRQFSLTGAPRPTDKPLSLGERQGRGLPTTSTPTAAYIAVGNGHDLYTSARRASQRGGDAQATANLAFEARWPPMSTFKHGPDELRL